ncbi:hypothetical protein [Streptomyces sp. NPDC006012]|uniref:hypothetical protein n=1 Tax=Streptomyces sp. NPDC006012 TaxID=3364739 RepID=UPI0036BE56D1
MGLFSRHDVSTESDADLLQGLDLAVEIAQDGRESGNRKREAGAHADINNRLDEVERRGLFGRR